MCGGLRLGLCQLCKNFPEWATNSAHPICYCRSSCMAADFLPPQLAANDSDHEDV